MTIARFVCVALPTLLTAAPGASGTSRPAALLREHNYVAFDVSPDGKSVVFTPADGVTGIYVLDLGMRTVRQLVSVRAIATSPVYSPDGKEIVFAAATGEDAPFHLFLYSLATQKVSQITNESSASDRSPSYSSDGTTITFARASRQRPYSTGGLTWDDWDVATIASDGSNFRRRTDVKYYRVSSPRFAANDSALVYTAVGRTKESLAFTLFRVSLRSSGTPSPLLPSVTTKACGARGSDPSLSRDGRYLAFIADGQECYKYDIYVGGESAGNPKALGVTRVSSYNKEPVFVPRSAQIMYLAGTEDSGNGRKRYSLYAVERDGSRLQQAAGPSLFDDPLHWRGN